MSLPKKSRTLWRPRLGGALLAIGLQAGAFATHAQQSVPDLPGAASAAPATQSAPAPTQIAPTPTQPIAEAGPDRATLEALRAHLEQRRLELNQEREDLAKQRANFEAVDVAAEPALIATWRAIEDDSRALDNRTRLLDLLAERLTAEALQAVALPQFADGQLIVPQERKLVWIRSAANLRHGPTGEGQPFKVLDKSTPVVIVAHHAAGSWSLVASPSGFGFVLSGQLQVDQ